MNAVGREWVSPVLQRMGSELFAKVISKGPNPLNEWSIPHVLIYGANVKQVSSLLTVTRKFTVMWQPF